MANQVIDRPVFPFVTERSEKANPFLKWAGGKGQLLEEIRLFYPSELGVKIKKYAEPFVGGGAVLFDVLNNFNLDEVYISDKNAELINTYKVIRDTPEKVIKILKQYQNEFLPADIEQRKSYYYYKRDRFNYLKAQTALDVEAAALFIFLNRTCFNGLYRVNSRGDFNVPMGSYKNPLICNEENLMRVSLSLRNVHIINGDYKELDSFIDRNTFVYFDPPYRPLNVSSSFTSYTENEFNDNDQIELASYISMLKKRGTRVLASNSDPKNVDQKDDFFDELYSEFIIKRVKANRMINSNPKSRGGITELLISNMDIL
jgi:DNA adenine methylase